MPDFEHVPPKSEDIQIRYSRFGTGSSQVPKNTLFTWRHDDQVYFGIARCNLDADVPSKALGRCQARFRAEHAVRSLPLLQCVMYIDHGGLEGKCHENSLPMLLDYFYGLDRK